MNYPLQLKEIEDLLSPYSDAAELLILIMRIKEMICNLRSLDCNMNYPLQLREI